MANSGRMLAKAAHYEGFEVLVIDCYADLDTFFYAKQVQKVISLAVSELQKAIENINHFVDYVLYGSGFELYPESLFFLAQNFKLVGNSPCGFQRIQNKKSFFWALAQFEIPHPKTQFIRPEKSENWLVKPLKNLGGVDVGILPNPPLKKEGVYFQQFVTGKLGSVLFLANGKRAEIIGFNSQSVDEHFLFQGVLNHIDLSKKQKTQVADWLQQLMIYFDLKGLHSLDFIKQQETLFVLEINARPPASMQLYSEKLITRHIAASFGNLIKINKSRKKTVMCGYQILFAKRKMTIPKYFLWLPECADLPHSGAIIPKNAPICSMIARGNSASCVLKSLSFIQNKIERSLFMTQKASVNKLAQPLVQQLIEQADKLRVGIETLENGCTIIDAGINHLGGLEAGRIIAEICLGGMGTVTLTHNPYTANWPLSVNVHTGNPVLGCLGSQYAGWSLSHEKYYALGSGPARAMATKQKEGQTLPVEELYQELAYRDEAEKAVLVIENDAIPPVAIVEKVAAACGISPEKLTIIVTPTSSLAGGVQVVARVLEVAMHKAHALHFPLENIIDGSGSAPICPPHPNFVKAMGRTNDAILFAGQVHIFVKGSDEAAEQLAKALPSSTSKDYGKPFADIFKAYEYDFFKVDAMLFSPAVVIVTAVESGKTFRAGQLDNALLDQSFGL